LAQGKVVVGSLDDFAHRCVKHLPHGGPDTIYVHPDLMARLYPLLPPQRNVVIMDLKGAP